MDRGGFPVNSCRNCNNDQNGSPRLLLKTETVMPKYCLGQEPPTSSHNSQIRQNSSNRALVVMGLRITLLLLRQSHYRHMLNRRNPILYQQSMLRLSRRGGGGGGGGGQDSKSTTEENNLIQKNNGMTIMSQAIVMVMVIPLPPLPLLRMLLYQDKNIIYTGGAFSLKESQREHLQYCFAFSSRNRQDQTATHIRMVMMKHHPRKNRNEMI